MTDNCDWKHSNCYNVAQALKDRTKQQTNARFAEGPRDLPLIIGWHGWEAVLASVDLDQGNTLLNQAMGSIIACAVRARAIGRGVSFSKREGFYTGLRRYHPAMRFSVVPKAVDALERIGLIDVVHGRTWREGGRGVQSSLWATETLVQSAGQIDTLRPSIDQVIRLLNSDGNLIGYEDTLRTVRMRRDLVDWNEHNSSIDIGIDDDRVRRHETGLLEVPTKDGSSTFFLRADSVQAFRQFNGRWDQHGRFYGPWWQNLPKALRAKITIDDRPVAKADFANSHLRIAYSEAGADPGLADGYQIAGYDDVPGRKLVKLATQVCFNDTAGKRHAIETVGWEIAKRDRILETGSDQNSRIGSFERRAAMKVIEAVEDRHRPIARVFYTGSGLRFMATEAEVHNAVAKAARKLNIPVLGVHDEFIAQDQCLGDVVGLMYQEWNKRINVQAIVR